MPEVDLPNNTSQREGYSESWKVEYEQVSNNFRMLAETRFKLLALVPTLTGSAVYLLSKMTAGQQGADYAMVGFLSVLGFLATMGITFYDQRNSELYNLLVKRAREMERLLIPPMKNFEGRIRASRFLFGCARMKHDTGLALIYAPVLGAWFFPLVDALLLGNHRSATTAMYISLLSSLTVGALFFEEFMRLDRQKR
ncbi:MAG TPA: hypothetical protein VE377_16455 [Candidatus Dormibacteraeota bacterium]|nr:hypothetical protein [Candidatus Dormibacteraeota bacterium]